MKLKIGQKVLYQDEMWEIFKFESPDRYFIWNKDNGLGKEVTEDEIIGL